MKNIGIIDIKANDWTWYVTGAVPITIGRVAKINPTVTQQPKNIGSSTPSTLNDTLDASFYLYDHLGNTRVVYTPQIQCPSFIEYTVDYAGDFYPYGKTLREFAIDSPGEKFLTTQHERDAETGLDYRGARFYDSDVARFLSLDPHARKYPSLNDYMYVFANPISVVDPDGKDGIYIAFKDYEADGYPYTGHAGVLIWDNETGVTKYYAYGRYKSSKGNVVKAKNLSDLVLDENGVPTIESLHTVLEEISEFDGHGQSIEGAFIASDNFDLMNDYAQEKLAEGENGIPYAITTHNCGTFSCDVLRQDPEVADKMPWIIDPRPYSMIEAFQRDSDFNIISYDAEKEITTVHANKHLYIYDSDNKETKSVELPPILQK